MTHYALNIPDTLIWMGEMAVEELRHFFASEPLPYQVTPNMFGRTA